MIERQNSVDTLMSETKAKPSFVFVDNRSERMVMLRRTIAPESGEKPPKGTPTEQESTAVGRGLNYIRAEFVAANPDMGVLGCSIADPTKFGDGEVGAVLQRCTSRQAMNEWGKLEKRPRVVDQIRARLTKPAVPVQTEDAEA